ncbi:trypsin-like serine protease [Streptomyces sp. NPDC001820]|uniref:trypsin-like serine protease n=1 Tax=Streptomyces sp. NPDC001820 TaxID=3364613 RepID=UPI0036B6E9C7
MGSLVPRKPKVMQSCRPSRLSALASTFIAVPLALSAVPASAVTGTADTNNAYTFTARLEIGEGDAYRAYSGALVDSGWVLTAASCFTGGLAELTPGKPAEKTIATIGRGALTGTGGHTTEVVELVPRADRDLVMVRLSQPATTVTPLGLASTPANWPSPGSTDSQPDVPFGAALRQAIGPTAPSTSCIRKQSCLKYVHAQHQQRCS